MLRPTDKLALDTKNYTLPLKAYQGLPFVKRTEFFGEETVADEDKVPAKEQK